MTSKKSFHPKARAEEIAAQLKAAEDEQRRYDASIDEAVKNAGRTRAEFVEVLYDHFGIEPETTERRDKNGQPVLTKDGDPVVVKTDKDETVRIEKLAKKFEQLVAKAEASSRTGAAAKPSAADGAADTKFADDDPSSLQQAAA